MKEYSMPKGKHDFKTPAGSMNSGRGHDPQTTRISKHPVKSLVKKGHKGSD